MSVQPDEEELQLRDRLRDLGVSYAPAPDPDATPPREPEAGHLEHAAPAAEEEAPVPDPRQTAPRMRDWWAPDRPPLNDEDQPEDLTPAPGDEESEEPDDGREERDGFRARLRKHLEGVPTVADALAAEKAAKAAEDAEDDVDEEEDQEDDVDEEEDGPEPGGPVRKMATGLKRRARRPGRRPRFAAAGVPHTMKAERRSLVEIIRSTPDHVWWLAYNGSALAAGFWLGWPQWVKDGTAFLATEHPSLTDAYSFTCYALAAGVFVLDYRARGWLFPVSWLARIPTASLVVGVPLHGVDTPISQLF